jgi:hypothetical protein
LQILHIPDVNLAQKLPRRCRSQYALHLQQLLRARITTQHLQIAQVLTPQQQIVDQATDGLSFF